MQRQREASFSSQGFDKSTVNSKFLIHSMYLNNLINVPRAHTFYLKHMCARVCACFNFQKFHTIYVSMT